MSKTKLTINVKGICKIEGDFEIVDKQWECIMGYKATCSFNLSLWSFYNKPFVRNHIEDI